MSDKVLEFLADGQDHLMSVLYKFFRHIEVSTLDELMTFLDEFSFIKISNGHPELTQVQLTQPTYTFLKNIRWIERSEGRQPTFLEFVNLVREACEQIRAIKMSHIKGKIELQSRKPSSLRAAMIWLLSKKRGYNVTHHALMFIYDATPATLIKDAKLLRRLLESNEE